MMKSKPLPKLYFYLAAERLTVGTPADVQAFVVSPAACAARLATQALVATQ